MRIFAISDIHVDFSENRHWVENLSRQDYQEDILILAGDITDSIPLLAKTFSQLKQSFKSVFFVPGNHDLWVVRNKINNSLEAFYSILQLAQENGIKINPAGFDTFSILPLYSWYDFSFGEPTRDLKKNWADFVTCKWPDNFNEKSITQYFLSLNETAIATESLANVKMIISFSHFLPRIDLMPFFIPMSRRKLYPVLGTKKLDDQIRKMKSRIHIYGHSHVNQQVKKNETVYINNAFGYPYETHISAKRLVCIHEI